VRIERRVDGRCRHSPVHRLHVWMEYARARNGLDHVCFCSRCSVRGVFGEAELERWRQLLEAANKRLGLS
jgi:hypothetical protein